MENILETLVPFLQGCSLNNSNAWMIRQTDDLQAMYDWLKSSDRDAEMGALSATNRRTLILTPGTYTLTATLTLDTDYVDVVNISGNPKDTLISYNGAVTIEQTANDLLLIGFTVKNTSSAPYSHSFVINSTDNSPSVYWFMHFRKSNAANTKACIHGTTNINGTWSYCEGDNYSWRPGNNSTLGATMSYCKGGTNSFGGDATNSTISGTLRFCEAGIESFGGCLQVGCNISGTLEDCVAGDRSYAMGKIFSGIARRCVGGAHCFSGWNSTTYYGTFSGYAEDCTASNKSFGSGNALSKNSGELVRCRITAMTGSMYCESAKIKDSYLQITTTDKSTLDLNDGNTKVYNSTLIANGTGKSITAGEAQNVLALHCRMNLDKHANVTNLVGDGSLSAGYCIVDSDVT